MAEQHERVPRRWLWRYRIGVVGLLVIVAAALCVWQFAVEPLLAERRPFIGTWRLESPPFPARPELAVEVDILSDGTIRDRVWNPRTGAVDHEQLRSGRWSVTGGRFREDADSSALPRWLGGGGGGGGWDHRVTREGPDRLRLEGASAAQPTMVWVRQSDRPRE